MKTSLLDKSVAISVVAATHLALFALWAPRLEGAADFAAPTATQAPLSFEAQAGCAVELPPLRPKPLGQEKPSRRGFWL